MSPSRTLSTPPGSGDTPEVGDLSRAFIEDLFERAGGTDAVRTIDWPALDGQMEAGSAERRVGQRVVAGYLATKDLGMAAVGVTEVFNEPAARITEAAPLAVPVAPVPPAGPRRVPPQAAPVETPGPLKQQPTAPLLISNEETTAPQTEGRHVTTSLPPSPARRFGSHHPGKRRRQRLLSGFTWVRNVGIILLLFAGWQIWGTALSQHHAQAQLATEFQSHVQHSHRPGASGLVQSSTYIPDPSPGTVLARIRIPAIGVDQYVVSGTTEQDLAQGPGHYAGTAMPGQAGNVAIAGHRTTYGAPFFELGKLVPGNSIVLTTLSGQPYTYVVSKVPYTVKPGEVSVLDDFGDNRLTLTTCNPPYSAAQRLIVVASFHQAGGTLSTPPARYRPHAYHLRGGDPSSWGWGSFVWVLVAVAVLFALGWNHQRLSRLYGEPGRWLILVPIWMAALILLFQSLSGFLPASV
jgi:sortase A